MSKWVSVSLLCNHESRETIFYDFFLLLRFFIIWSTSWKSFTGMFWSRFSNIVSLSIAKGESSEFGLLVNFEQFIFYPTQNLDCLDKGELFQTCVNVYIRVWTTNQVRKIYILPNAEFRMVRNSKFFFCILVPTRYVNDTVGSL